MEELADLRAPLFFTPFLFLLVWDPSGILHHSQATKSWGFFQWCWHYSPHYICEYWLQKLLAREQFLWRANLLLDHKISTTFLGFFSSICCGRNCEQGSLEGHQIRQLAAGFFSCWPGQFIFFLFVCLFLTGEMMRDSDYSSDLLWIDSSSNDPANIM